MTKHGNENRYKDDTLNISQSINIHPSIEQSVDGHGSKNNMLIHDSTQDNWNMLERFENQAKDIRRERQNIKLKPALDKDFNVPEEQKDEEER